MYFGLTIGVNMPKIFVEGIWAEDLFTWFYNRVNGDGGEGYAALVCSNFEDVGNYFKEWMINNFHYTKYFQYTKHDNSVSFTLEQEGYLITNDKNITFGGSYDYIFVVNKDCHFGLKLPDSPEIIKAI